MKNAWNYFLILILLIFISFSGCNNKEDETSNVQNVELEDDNSSNNESIPEPVAGNDTSPAGGMEANFQINMQSITFKKTVNGNNEEEDIAEIGNQQITEKRDIRKTSIRVQVPVAVYNKTKNEFFIVWNDDREGYLNIYGRRVNAENGTFLSEEIIIKQSNADKTVPIIAYNPIDDQYLVAWDDYRNGDINPFNGSKNFNVGWNPKIYGILLDSTGNRIAEEFFIGEGFRSDLVFHPIKNRYYITYADNIYRNYVVKGITREGILEDDNIHIEPGEGFLLSVLVPNLDSQEIGFLFSFYDGVNGEYYSKFDIIDLNSSMTLKKSISLDYGSRSQVVPFASYNPIKKEYFIVEEDIGNLEIIGNRISDNQTADIRGTLLNSNGDIVMANYFSQKPTDEWDPSVTFSKYMNSYFIIYNDLTDDNHGNIGEIWLRRVDADSGNLVGGPILLARDMDITFSSKKGIVTNESGDTIFIVYNNEYDNEKDGTFCQLLKLTDIK